MKKIISIPPIYFYISIGISIPFRFFFPNLNLISFPWNFIGLLLIAFGILFVIIPYKLFVKHNTPEKFLQSTCVVTVGLYKYSRNPMYFGGLLFLLGLAVVLQNLLSFISPLFFFLIINFMFIPFEEEKMKAECGDEYISYKNKVRKWI